MKTGWPDTSIQEMPDLKGDGGGSWSKTQLQEATVADPDGASSRVPRKAGQDQLLPAWIGTQRSGRKCPAPLTHPLAYLHRDDRAQMNSGEKPSCLE